jgi:hypothetical protein
MDYIFKKYNKEKCSPLVGYQHALNQAEGVFTKEEISKIAAAFKLPHIEFPDFGCILFFRSINNRQFNLELLFPDQWEYRIFKEQNRSTAAQFSVLYPGTLLKKDEPAFREKLTTQVLDSSLFGLTSEHKKQKTPVLIEYCIKKALNLPNVSLPSGGTTDVGKHTGTKPYDTMEHIWDYSVKRVIKDDVLWNKWMVWNHVWPLEFLVQNSSFRNHKECALVHVILDSFAESSENFQFPELIQKCEQLKAQYTAKKNSEAKKTAEEYTFDIQVESGLQHQSYTIKEYDLDQPSRDILATYESPTGPKVPTIGSVDELLENLENKKLKLDLKMTAVEDWFFTKVNIVSVDPCQILLIIEYYEGFLKQWSSSDDYQSFRISEIRSKYSLITWMGYCMAHKFLRESKLKGANNIGIALDKSAMKYWSLPSKLAKDSSIRVWEYLQNFTSSGLFCLKNDNFTIEFAREFALNDEKCLRMWSNFQSAKREAIDKRNATVESKRKSCAEIRKEIVDIKADVYQKQKQLSEMFEFYTHFSRSDRHFAHNAVESVQSRLRRKENELIDTLKSPRFVVHGLPRELKSAAPILFFANMPRNLRSFGELTMKAITSMVPWQTHQWETRPNDQRIVKAQERLEFPFEFTKHCCTSYDNQFQLVGTIGIPNNYGANTIEGIFDEMDGHWFPDYTKMNMIWKHGAPHSILNSFSEDYFTETVPPEFQFMVEYPAQSVTRGNLTYSSISKRGTHSYLVYTGLGSIRAYPQTQLRRLLCELESQIIPLSDSLVKNVIYSSLFQIGPFTSRYDHVDEWHHDFWNGGLLMFEQILTKLLNNLEMTVRNASNMECVARLVSFLSQWLPESTLLNRVIDVNMKWIRLESGQSKIFSSRKEEFQSKGKEWLRHAYLILCFEFSMVPADHLPGFLMSVVFCQHLKLFGLQSSFKDEIVRLGPIVSRICSQQLSNAILLLDNGKESCLTRIVKNFDFTCPKNLIWKRLGDSSIYESRSQNIYTIDIQAGTYLQNGFPPSRLPRNILDCDGYKKIFGNHEFEVSLGSNGCFNTTKTLHGYHYTFFLKDDTLWIQELHNDSSEHRIFVPVHYFKTLVPNLPRRFHDMHSHWWDAKQKCFLLRPVNFLDKSKQL